MSIIIPFFIMAILLIGLILASNLLSRLVVSKKSYWLLGAYATILIIGFIAYLFIPQDEQYHNKETKMGGENLDSVLYEHEDIEKVSEYLQKEWEFELEGKMLQLRSEDYEGFGINVLLDRKEENDQVIKAAYYKTPINYMGKDLGELVEPIALSQDGIYLTIITPEEIRLEYSSFQYEFPMKLFKEDRDEMDYLMDYHFDLEYGQQFLYLQVPSDVEVLYDDSIYVEYMRD